MAAPEVVATPPAVVVPSEVVRNKPSRSTKVQNKRSLKKYDLQIEVIDGTPFIKVPKEVLEGNPLWEDLLIGKFLSTAPHVGKVHVIVNKIWSFGDKSVKVDVYVVNSTIFKFRIRDSSVRARVLRRGTWTIANVPMIIWKLTPETQSQLLDDSVSSEEVDDRYSRELKAGLHPLRYKFAIWYTRQTTGVRSKTSYEDNIKKIVDFSTVEGFWACYCHLAPSSSLTNPTDLHYFKDGIGPLWEDAANCNGGKWIIRFSKAVSARFWEDLLLALVGDQLNDADEICGAVLSICFKEDIVRVWNRNASDHQAVMGLRDSIKRHLKLPHAYVMKYKPHDASIFVPTLLTETLV